MTIRNEQLRRRKRSIERRLENSSAVDRGRPMLSPAGIKYELSERAHGICYGGIGAMLQFANKIGLTREIDQRLQLLMFHKPYHESDHVLNLAFNALCRGSCLEDIELRRNDEGFLDALGTERVPDPTTAGDFCRRFAEADIRTLMDVFDSVRMRVWSQQPARFFEQATIDMDGSLVETTGECKKGMDISYKGVWGYHPLIVSLAETGEVLRIVNRSGNRPSHEGAAKEVDSVIRLCEQAGFKRILLRGDTDFTQTTKLDEWDNNSKVRFIFGMDATANLQVLADDLPRGAWKRLRRPARYEVKTERRRKPRNVKERIVREREFENIRLESEDVAEFKYSPTACKKTYRVVVVRKNLAVEKGQNRLFNDYRYFFYITNDWESSPPEIVLSANQRCDQENLVEQLKNGVRSLTAPVDNLLSNWAYMVMTSLAWNLKAWFALSLPEDGRWIQQRQQEKRRVLSMEFKRFVGSFIMLPCQIVNTGRQIVYRLLGWNPDLPIFRRFLMVFQE